MPFSCVLGGPRGQSGLGFLPSGGPKEALSEVSSWDHATLCTNSFSLCTEFSFSGSHGHSYTTALQGDKPHRLGRGDRS